MTAVYRGDVVHVVRIEAHRAYVIWRGKLKRVNKVELENEPPIAGQMHADGAPTTPYRRESLVASAVETELR